MKSSRTWISIHAPREGGDNISAGAPKNQPHFNPRPPRGGRLINQKKHLQKITFQSTPPARGATANCWSLVFGFVDFNPRPPRGGRHGLWKLMLQNKLFQSTPPARGATGHCIRLSAGCMISIHAPREGGDDEGWFVRQKTYIISIHAPREGGDYGGLQWVNISGISIHAPREGGDEEGTANH